MSHNLFHFEVSAFDLAIRALGVFLFVLLLLRISGKRQLGQMSPTEFVAILLISNAVQNAMNGGDNSLIGGLWLALILIALSVAISFLTFKYRFWSALFEGKPTIIIRHGKLHRKNMMRERLSESELRTLLRKQGLHDIADIEVGILESDGSLSVTKVNEKRFAYHENGMDSLNNQDF